MTTRPRPVGTPAYYLGRPAAFWRAAFRRQPANGTSPHASCPEPSLRTTHEVTRLNLVKPGFHHALSQ